MEKRKEERLIDKPKRKERKVERETIILIPRSTWGSQSNAIYECESIWVSYQKHNKVTERVLSWVPVPIKPYAIIKNVSS